MPSGLETRHQQEAATLPRKADDVECDCPCPYTASDARVCADADDWCAEAHEREPWPLMP